MGIPAPGYFRSYFPFNLSGCQDILKIWLFIKAAGLVIFCTWTHLCQEDRWALKEQHLGEKHNTTKAGKEIYPMISL